MNDSIQDAVLIVNPQAGRARTLLSGRLDRVRAELGSQGIETEIAVAGPNGHAEELAREAVHERRHLVIACGGDGTLNAVVNGLAGSNVPMALLPAGTANILAKELSLPWDIEQAARYIKSGTLRRIALGAVTACNGSAQNRYFLSVGGAGPDGAMVQAVHEGLKRHAGTLAFWAEGARQFLTYGFPRFNVTAASETLPATLIVVGRTKHYGGPLSITSNADLFGSDFEVMVCASRSRLLYLSHVPMALIRQMHRAYGVRFFRATHFRCEPLDSPAALLQVDGEPLGHLPAEFRIVPDALTLVVPNSVAASAEQRK